MSEKALNKTNIFSQITKKLEQDNKGGTEFTPEQAMDIADMILLRAEAINYYGTGPTPIADIAEGFGIKTYSADDLAEEISGVIYVNGTTEKEYGSEKVIFTKQSDPEGHQRFVAAHELGHYLFDFLGNEKYKDKRLLFEENYPKEHHESAREIRANRFASELLMPKKLFIEQYSYAANCRENPNHNYIFIIMYLAEYFRVKVSSIERRIDEIIYGY